MRVDLAGRTIRYLSGILDHPEVTPDHLKDCRTAENDAKCGPNCAGCAAGYGLG